MRGYSVFEVANYPAIFQRAKQHAYERLEDRSYQPVIDPVFAFEDVADAHRHMVSNEQMGKIVAEF
ncbi:MAG: zinc-binding dehydrogenase [Proteobacteria bacterium]|nr:zinc-binding dehydrogenase [Pseudomonadota bacterium]